MEYITKVLSLVVDFVSGQMTSVWQTARYLHLSKTNVVIDILITAVLFYYLIQWVKVTRARQMLTGLLLIGLLYVISRTAGLISVQWLLSRFFTVVMIAIPIIFQEEIRRGLQKLGEARIFSRSVHLSQNLIKEIIHAVYEMSEQKIGALIVLARDTNLDEYAQTGTHIDAKLCGDLLTSLFKPGAPLHDGAVIIKNNRIMYAGCTLPQSSKKYGGQFGTRHKAALSLSEITDAVCIIVSEEKRKVSVAMDGELHSDVTQVELNTLLNSLL